MMLVNTPELPFLRVSWTVIVPVVAATVAVFTLAISAGVRAQRQPAATGAEGLLGETGVARTLLDPEGQVLVQGEIWRAVAQPPPIGAGEPVRVVGLEGLTLKVTRPGVA